MSDLMDYLFTYASERKTESRKERIGWVKLEKALDNFEQSKDRDELETAVIDYGIVKRYRGFLDGFWLATKLWKDTF